MHGGREYWLRTVDSSHGNQGAHLHRAPIELGPTCTETDRFRLTAIRMDRKGASFRPQPTRFPNFSNAGRKPAMIGSKQ